MCCSLFVLKCLANANVLLIVFSSCFFQSGLFLSRCLFKLEWVFSWLFFFHLCVFFFWFSRVSRLFLLEKPPKRRPLRVTFLEPTPGGPGHGSDGLVPEKNDERQKSEGASNRKIFRKKNSFWKIFLGVLKGILRVFRGFKGGLKSFKGVLKGFLRVFRGFKGGLKSFKGV